jgi:glutathione S-transferase
MQLYFAPLACSMAARIALIEAGAEAEFTLVDLKQKRLEDGGDFLVVSPLGQVPALRTDSGDILTENGAVLQYVADRYPEAGLAPASGIERARLWQWLSFLGTEVHKGIFGALFDPTAPKDALAHARSRVPVRFARLEQHLTGREFMLDRFSIADAYLATILNWCLATEISLDAYPALAAFRQRMLERPSVKKAMHIELPLYQAELARQAS